MPRSALWTVADQLADVCRTSVVIGHADPLSAGENFLYVFKGARSAPGLGRQLTLDRRHATQALAPMRRSSRPAAGRCLPGERSHAGHLVPLLGTPCHGGVGALQASGTGRSQRAARKSQRPARALQGLPSSRRSSIEPRKVTIKSAPSARPVDGASATLDTDLPRLVRRLSGRWLRLKVALRDDAAQ